MIVTNNIERKKRLIKKRENLQNPRKQSVLLQKKENIVFF